MDAVLSLVAILSTLFLGVVSPGPCFVLVARTALASSRRDGLGTAIGMGLGGVFFGALAILGLATVLARAEFLYLGLKLAGGAYLLYLGIAIWRGATTPLQLSIADAAPRPHSLLRAIWIGFATQVSNPKTAVIYASVFAALMPAEPPLWFLLALPPLLFVLEGSWYAVVALAFSAGRPRAVYLRAKTAIDRLAGGVMGLLGTRLLYEAARPG